MNEELDITAWIWSPGFLALNRISEFRRIFVRCIEVDRLNGNSTPDFLTFPHTYFVLMWFRSRKQNRKKTLQPTVDGSFQFFFHSRNVRRRWDLEREQSWHERTPFICSWDTGWLEKCWKVGIRNTIFKRQYFQYLDVPDSNSRRRKLWSENETWSK